MRHELHSFHSNRRRLFCHLLQFLEIGERSLGPSSFFDALQPLTTKIPFS